MTGLGERVPTEIVLHTGAGEPSRRAVDGSTTVGGSQADGITVAGLAPAALRLDACAAGVVVRPAVAGLRVEGRAVAPGASRLLRPGERATLRNLTLELPPPTPDGRTRVAAAALLREVARGAAIAPGPQLVILTGAGAGERVPLVAELIIGRGRGAELRVRDPAASRRHARVRSGAGGVTVEDLGAKNRLRVNGVAVERRPVRLEPGDRLTVGETELAFEDDARPAAGPVRARRSPTRRPARRERPRAGARPLAAAAFLAASAAVLAAASSCGL